MRSAKISIRSDIMSIISQSASAGPVLLNIMNTVTTSALREALVPLY